MYFSKLLLSDIIEYAATKGVDSIELYQLLNYEKDEQIDPREHITYDEMIAALNVTGQLIDDEYLGLHVGQQMALKATQQVDDIMRNSATIEAAFSNATTYSKLISDALTTSMLKTEDYIKITFDVNPNWIVLENHAVRQVIDMTLICTLQSLSWLTGVRQSAVEVHLNYPSVKKKIEYYKVFNCPLKFNEPKPCILFYKPTLDRPILSPQEGLLEFLKKAANDELSIIQSEPILIRSIKEIVLDRLPGRCAVADVADEMNVSRRTLQRNLRDLETNFKTIEKDILIKLAQKLVVYEERTIDEISFMLGFSESSALIRFFKNELNTTPKRYKKSKLGCK